jgi:hypothetical protein
MARLRRSGLTVITMVCVATVVLLVTGWGSAVASSVSSVFVTNTSGNPVPVQAVGTVPVHEQGTAKTHEQNLDAAGNIKVAQQGTANTREQNLDANGNIKVHEQGTANVDVTNSSLTDASPPPITGGGEQIQVSGGDIDQVPGTASALSIHMTAGVERRCSC